MSGSATTAESAATGIRDEEMSEASHDVLLGGVAPDAYEETVEEASRRLNMQLRRNDNNEEQRHIKYYSDVYPVGVQTPYVKSMFYHAAWDVVDCLVFGAWAVSYWPHVDTRSQTEFGIIRGLVFCFCLLACVLGFLYEMVHRTTNINESTRTEVFTTGSVVYPTIWWLRDSFEDGVSAQSYARLELVVDFFVLFFTSKNIHLTDAERPGKIAMDFLNALTTVIDAFLLKGPAILQNIFGFERPWLHRG
ncbi:unnamed protein product [Symbiodinium microadriaticum]|nr:unnamed protein product [Symbiodinium microadriaticum]